jgi:hypothetical protein
MFSMENTQKDAVELMFWQFNHMPQKDASSRNHFERV